MAAKAAKNRNWLPLESNPDVLNKFIHRLGVPAGYNFVDVFGFDEELLGMVPQPVLGVVLLYPSKKISAQRPRQEAERVADGRDKWDPSKVFYLKQHDDSGNACGTIATLHTLGNLHRQGQLPLEAGALKTFFEADEDCEKRGHTLLEVDELFEVSEECAGEGQTAPAERGEKVDYHFIALVNVNGTLWDLDGRKPFPFSYGPTTPETLLSDAARIIREQFAPSPQSTGC
mmetsp:Transcript_53130/g.115371  ORF Transcript_53130/g.115371 Transcript_53130/m.115371 type:complete len:230 (-) Transcript_53130:146-835(-)